MIDWVVDGGFTLLEIVGLPILSLVFVVKGAIVGKVLPTSVFLPGYVLAISASPLEIALILGVTSVAYFAGQMVVYYYSRRHGVRFARSLPGSYVTEQRLARSTAMFDRYGGAGIFVTNCVPFLGGLLFVPAGMTRYSLRRTVLYGYTSTLLYQTVIVLVALGAARVLLGYLWL